MGSKSSDKRSSLLTRNSCKLLVFNLLNGVNEAKPERNSRCSAEILNYRHNFTSPANVGYADLALFGIQRFAANANCV